MYFAYGSNMDEGQMRIRCPRSRSVGVGRLAGHRFLISAHGFATVIPDQSRTVWGILWDLDPRDEERLDRYEAIEDGLYSREFRVIETSDGRRVDALIYVATDARPGKGSSEYLNGIVRAAESVGLPEAYRRELREALRDDEGGDISDS